LESASRRGNRRDRAGYDIWNNTLADLPVYDSTCVSFHGSLLAIGGRDEQYNVTTAVRRYMPATNTWEVISHMEQRRYQCFAVVVPNNCGIMVVGGALRKFPRFVCTSEVEVTV
jgi:N-acetylneuraminic acid mutarotase